MEIIVLPDENAAAGLVTELIVHAVRAKPDLTLGLATGRTMELVYAGLVRAFERQAVQFAACTTFNLDEYIGLRAEDPNAYRAYMNRQLFDRTDIPRSQTHLPDGMAEDIKEECARYEQRIRAAGGIDLQLLGIGRSGHIGFNEPLSSLASRTRDKSLTRATVEQNAPLFPKPEDMPRRAITMGIGTILEAKKILTLVTGAEKAGVLAKAVEGPVTAMVAASALQLHPATVVVADEAAASELKNREYYDWIFQNEPEWEAYRKG